MNYLVGIITAVAIVGLARSTKFENDRSFYPTVLIVIGFLYLLFGAIDGRIEVILFEGFIALIFTAIALLGYRKSLVIVGIGIILHGIFDITHHLILENRGIPDFYAGFCFAVDVVLGGYVVFAAKTFQK